VGVSGYFCAAALSTLGNKLGYKMSRRVGFCAARETFLAHSGNGTKFFGRPGRRFINILTYDIPSPKPLSVRVKNRFNTAKILRDCK
jgi:hypothetical protein